MSDVNLSNLPLFSGGEPLNGSRRRTHAGHAAVDGSPDGERRQSSPEAPEEVPTSLVTAERLPDGMLPAPPVDWTSVAALRSQAAEQLAQAVDDGLDQDARQELGKAIILELLEAEAERAVDTGNTVRDPATQQALARAVFDSLFRLGRLQPLVDDPAVENIVITGCDQVWLDRLDGTLLRGPRVADTDQELVEFISFLAARAIEANARPFSEANPSLDLRLPDGSRLAATNWITARPSIVIRRHRLVQVSLADLVQLGSLTPVMASFLAAAVKARLSIVVAGAQGAGKTTLVRALCGEIDPEEQIATFEDPRELFLHEMPERHHIVHSWEARHGSGEIGADGRPAGEYTLEQQLRDSFRYNAQRQIVGEIRGPEVWAMIKAMESGSGSLSTTHAESAQAAMAKLVTCSMEAGPHVSRQLAASKLGQAIDLVVQLHAENLRDNTGRTIRRRWVSEIVCVSPGEGEQGYALTQVFRPTGDGPAQAALLPDELRDLAPLGFDLPSFLNGAAGGRGGIQ